MQKRLQLIQEELNLSSNKKMNKAKQKFNEKLQNQNDSKNYLELNKQKYNEMNKGSKLIDFSAISDITLENPNYIQNQKKFQSQIEQYSIEYYGLQDIQQNLKIGLDFKSSVPWLSERTIEINNPIVRLHNEIIEFYYYIVPSAKEHKVREKSYQKVKSLILSKLPDSEVHHYGSFATKLYLPNGDIDLVIMDNTKTNFYLMKKVKSLIKDYKEYKDVKCIEKAKVPLVKFIESKTNFSFDVSFNKMDGITQIHEIKKAFEVYPELKYLVMIIKCVLRQRELHETYTGGVGSFLVFCMVLTFLRTIRKQYLSQNLKKELQRITLGEYLLKFLNFYGNQFDSSQFRIVMQNKSSQFIQEKKKYENSGEFSLMSPQDPYHDMGSQSFNINQTRVNDKSKLQQKRVDFEIFSQPQLLKIYVLKMIQFVLIHLSSSSSSCNKEINLDFYCLNISYYLFSPCYSSNNFSFYATFIISSI